MDKLKVSDTITLLPGQDDHKKEIKLEREKEKFTKFFSNSEQLDIFLALPIPDDKRLELLSKLNKSE